MFRILGTHITPPSADPWPHSSSSELQQAPWLQWTLTIYPILKPLVSATCRVQVMIMWTLVTTHGPSAQLSPFAPALTPAGVSTLGSCTECKSGPGCGCPSVCEQFSLRDYSENSPHVIHTVIPALCTIYGHIKPYTDR